MKQINVPIAVLHKFITSACDLPGPGSDPSIESGSFVVQVVQVEPENGLPELRRRIARVAAEVRHSKPGGSREKQAQIREMWASGHYSSRDRCAEEECGALGMSFSTARKALRRTPDPYR